MLINPEHPNKFFVNLVRAPGLFLQHKTKSPPGPTFGILTVGCILSVCWCYTKPLSAFAYRSVKNLNQLKEIVMIARPWSRPDLLQRLSTYHLYNVAPLVRHQTENLGPVSCARHGWKVAPKQNHNDDICCLICETCGGSLDIALPTGEIAVELYVKQLHLAHKSTCVWSKMVSSKDVYAHPASTMHKVAVEWFKETFAANAKYIHSLPSDAITQDEQLNEPEVFEQILRLLGPDVEDSPANRTVISVTLLGWTAKVKAWRGSDSVKIVDCEYCHRTIMVENSGEGPEKEQEIDVVKSHRFFCWWVSEVKNHSMPGWKQVLSKLLC